MPMNIYQPTAWFALLALAACAEQPTRPETQSEQPAVAAPAPKPRVVVRPNSAKPPVLPPQALSQAVLFKLLLAEIALQRGQNNVAVQSFVELTRETRDPRIAQRATEVAWNTRFLGAALETAGIWLAVDPDSQQARQILAALLVNQSKLADAQPHLEKSLAADKENVGNSFMQLNTLLARHPDKAAVLELTQNLAKPYPGVPEAHYSIAQAAWAAEQKPLALTEIRTALKLRPDWEQAALFQGQVLQRSSNTEALAYYQGYLKSFPRAMDVRLSYARLLVTDKKYVEARAEFQSLLKEFPNNADVTMAVALLSLQLSDYDIAETQLLHALETDYKDMDAVRFYLGQVNEERKRPEDALRWYSSVNGGDQYVPARARYAGILAKQGKLGDARKYLQEAGRNAPEKVQFTQAEAQLLREANDYRAAFDLLGQAVSKNPNSPELLYDQAMAAEKVDRIDVLESNLRKVIQMKPDYAHAYNALGYTLADRNTRLSEAYTLVEQALKLAPEDPFIMDSMGWVLYRMNQNDAALTFLKRAFEIRSDAEIAAHLGEVLWAMGRHDEAKKVWAGALKESPANELLLATVKKFSP
ncbi:MAG: tetratricopeptide repeat protein [Betaproteobacteria bacterium]|nr:tetratricopeptide repeat protein [Betaproteobacteria bacterium]